MLFQHLFTNFYETTAVIVFSIGFTTLLLHRNFIKKIIGFNFMDTGVYLFLAAKGYITGRTAPIVLVDEVESGNIVFEHYINPIPAGLVLTGIVVSVSVTAILLSLAIRLYKRYHTLDMDRIVKLANKEEE